MKTTTAIIRILVLVLSALPVMAEALGQVHPAALSEPIPASYFGLHIHRPNDTWPPLAFGAWRLWDSRVTWYDLEPRKGTWQFDSLDKYVTMAGERHLDVLLTLGQSPAWASVRPTEGPTGRPGSAAAPSDLQYWLDYVRTVATRYKGRIHEYEVWNEPNFKQFFSGSVDELVVLEKEAYTIIHQVDPAAKVISPPVTGVGFDYLDSFLAKGGGRYADVIGYHFYVTPRAPEALADSISRVRQLMNKYGVNKPLWNTETGWFVESRFENIKGDSTYKVLKADQSVGYVMRAYVINWLYGAERLYWYDWDSNSMGLGDDLGKVEKPAAKGYATIREWLVGASMRSCTVDSDSTWICALMRDGRPQWIAWNPSRTIHKQMPKDWNIRRLSTVTGESRAVSMGDVELGPTPILLETR